MRALAVLLVAVLVSGALAGCVNTATKENPTTASVTPPTSPVKTDGKPITVLSALASSLATTSVKWVKPGSTVDVSASPPTNAKGEVKYVWSVGALPGTVATTPSPALDTGSKSPSNYIPVGADASLVFAAAGVYQMHCHPHAWMRSNVTVIEGYQGPSVVDVYIVDGETPGDYLYTPQNVVIPTNGKVVYHNRGTQPHTSTLFAQDAPALKLLPLTTASGSVTLSGAGWQRVRMMAIDGDGRIGNATIDFYVADLPAFQTIPVKLENQIGGAPDALQADTNKGFVLDYAATLTVKYAFKDVVAANGGPVNNAKATVHVKQSGSAQDTATDQGKAEGTMTMKVPADSYTLTVKVTDGVLVGGTVTIDAVYDLTTPPAPIMVGAGGGGGHHH